MGPSGKLQKDALRVKFQSQGKGPFLTDLTLILLHQLALEILVGIRS